MATETAAYEVLVNEEARLLLPEADRAIRHGSEGSCPNCGHLGLYDLIGKGLSAGSIYFSTAANKWRCMACEFDSVGY